MQEAVKESIQVDVGNSSGQQSGFVRNGFHMCCWRVSEERVRKGGGRLGGGDGKFSSMTCTESLASGLG